MIACSTCGKPVDHDGVCPVGHPFLGGIDPVSTDKSVVTPTETPDPAVEDMRSVGVRCSICGTYNDECGTCAHMHTAHEQIAAAI